MAHVSVRVSDSECEGGREREGEGRREGGREEYLSIFMIRIQSRKQEMETEKGNE